MLSVLIEISIAFIFMAEYILRIWTADLLYPDLPPAAARKRFIFSKLGIIDLLSFLPFFVGHILIFLNILSMAHLARTIRMMRIFKLCRYTTVIPVIW